MQRWCMNWDSEVEKWKGEMVKLKSLLTVGATGGSPDTTELWKAPLPLNFTALRRAPLPLDFNLG